MAHYTHTLTDIEVACGVTLDDVAQALARGYMIDRDGIAFVMDPNTPPALASSTARCAFGGREAEFSHLSNGYPVYVPASEEG